VLNRVYANVLNKPILVPAREVTSLGSAVFAFLAAGVFETVDQAQRSLCPAHRTVEPDPESAAVYERLYGIYKALYFSFGRPDSGPVELGAVLPELRAIAAASR
jgi:L-ribulokinase